MTTPPPGPPPARSLLAPFPAPGPWLDHAFLQLQVAAQGSPAERQAVGNPDNLPRPWLPETCTDPKLRRDLWEWLEAVVIWINAQYTWDPTDLIATCWPEHPHIVRELTVIADQYRTAQAALNSVPLEEWHRYTLPMFLDRLHRRCRQHCEDKTGHKPSPGTGHQQRHTNNAPHRHATYRRDLDLLEVPQSPSRPGRPHLIVVDTQTGVIGGDQWP